MIRWFRNWRARRQAKTCGYVRSFFASEEFRERVWRECEAELLAEIEAAKKAEPAVPRTLEVDGQLVTLDDWPTGDPTTW